jgi:deazaflavin-dependent oxidoreductase (nitroreductase family)
MNPTATDARHLRRTQPGRPPRIVPLLNPISRRLLAAGVPMGPNALITVRGRTSGLPRSTPLAIIEVADRRWIWSPWGDVGWVRNLRAAGSATITLHHQTEDVRATELDLEQRIWFFRDILGPVARGMRFGFAFVRIVDGVDLNHPEEMAEGRRVFELHRPG